MIRGTALISTVYREGQGIRTWLDALAAQTVAPEEFVIVDGGSPDDTAAQIAAYAWPAHFPQPRVIIQPCNIAQGRNLAIRNTTAEIIVSTDAGSQPQPNWLEEITRPLLEDPTLDVVGGKTISTGENEWQKFVLSMEGQPGDSEGYYPSSRNVALRRRAWESVGGYPEWLTLAAEDALYNYELHAAGNKFACNNNAIVRWPVRPTSKDYFSLLYRNGYGAAEAHLYTSYFFRRTLVALFPFLLFLSPHRFSHLTYRYCKNSASALGWLAGKIKGRKPPTGWQNRNGILLSPETQRHRAVDQ